MINLVLKAVQIQRDFAEASPMPTTTRLCPQVSIILKLNPAEEHLLINIHKSTHILFASSLVYFGGKEHE